MNTLAWDQFENRKANGYEADANSSDTNSSDVTYPIDYICKYCHETFDSDKYINEVLSDDSMGSNTYIVECLSCSDKRHGITTPWYYNTMVLLRRLYDY